MAGSQSTKQEIPEWLESQSRGNIEMANEAAKVGYVPYYGPDVAAFTDAQNAAFNNTNQAANAFGMDYATGNGMPQATEFAGGVTGYSSGGLYDQAVDQLYQRNPGQYAKLNSFFIDPTDPAAASVGQIQPVVSQATGKGGK